MALFWNYSKIFTVEDIYGTCIPKYPIGYEPTDELRPPRVGEYFLGGETAIMSHYDWPAHSPRLILRKLPTTRKFLVEVEYADGLVNVAFEASGCETKPFLYHRSINIVSTRETT